MKLLPWVSTDAVPFTLSSIDCASVSISVKEYIRVQVRMYLEKQDAARKTLEAEEIAQWVEWLVCEMRT